MPRTQKQLADMAGVSIVTVYNALHRPTKVKRETRERITKLMNACDYLPDAVARSMVRGRTKIIGIIVPDIEIRYYAKAAGIMEKLFNQAGYRVLISQHLDVPTKLEQEISMMREYRVDGLVIRNCGLSVDDVQIARLDKAGMPFVLLDGTTLGFENHLVTDDDFNGSRLLVEKIIRSGRKRVGCIGFHRSGDFHNSNRFRGYLTGLENCGIAYDKVLVAPCLEEYKGGATAMRMILDQARNNPPDAVFCFNDDVALRVIRFLNEQGIPPQKEILVAGYSGYAAVDILPFRLPTVVSPLEKIGSAAVEMLLAQINGKPLKNEGLIFMPEVKL